MSGKARGVYALLIALMGTLLIFLSACGDSANNNQGVTFTALGWFQDSTGDTGQSGIVSPVSDPSDETIANNLEDITSFIGLQNNFSDQFVRSTQVIHEYFIPGASIQPPNSAFSVTAIVGPSADNGGDEFGQEGTLPDSFDSSGNTSYNEVAVVTSDVRSFINFNRESMPELPFNMLVESRVRGVTSSGQSVETNKVFIEVIFTNDVVVPPADGSTGTGPQTEEETAGLDDDEIGALEDDDSDSSEE